MVMAEISVTPVGTGQTGVSFYVARALEAVSSMPHVRYELNPMGTVLEADDIEHVLDAAKLMVTVLHNLGVARVSVIMKIDSRQDKHDTMSDKVKSVYRHMG